MNKIVHQTDVNGAYVGPVIADESPLEPGVFLIPAGAYEDPPPDVRAHEQVRRSGDLWIVEQIHANPAPSEPAPATDEQITSAIAADVQAHLDTAARAIGYHNIFTAVSYADEPAVARFQREGAAFRAWRSLVWEKCYALLAQVKSGEIEPMTAEQVIAELPQFNLPTPIPTP